MKILVYSLGCDKNLVDTEGMLGDLGERGYTFTDEEEEADVVIINTCCFIHDAKQESVDTILSVADRRARGDLKALLVTGCLAQRYGEEILKEIPEVDAVLGTTAMDEMGKTIDAILANDKSNQLCMKDLSLAPVAHTNRLLTTGGHYAYLKIAEGCNKCCTYCVIPSIRGPFRSVPMGDLIAEAKAVVKDGATELIVIAQETTVYGVDLYHEKKLPELLTKLSESEDLRWIRVLYCYPEEITDELISVFASNEKVLPYIDMPIQHASDAILKKMGRHTNRAELVEIIGKLRKAMPEICIRTTLITGFPGETEEDHKILLDFVKQSRFDRLGVFTYSKEEGTPAATMKPQVLQKVKKARQKEIMLLQQQIAFEEASRMEGMELTAVIEGKIADEDVYTARTYKDAPGVDGLLFVETKKSLMSGDFVKVKITGSKDYDLIGVLSSNEE